MAQSSLNQPRQRRRPMAEINVVPYIDVMLVLLVIFMVTAPLLSQGVQVELPSAAAEPLKQDEPEPLVVIVDAEGRYFLNAGDDTKSPLSADKLKSQVSRVLRRRPATPVYVRGDHRVDYGQVVTAMVLLQQAGVENVGLMTEPPESGR